MSLPMLKLRLVLKHAAVAIPIGHPTANTEWDYRFLPEPLQYLHAISVKSSASVQKFLFPAHLLLEESSSQVYQLTKSDLTWKMSQRIRDLITEANNIRSGNGLIFIHEADIQLFAVLLAAIQQCGFSQTLNDKLWNKTLQNGTRLNLVIYCYDDDLHPPLQNHARLAHNIIILTANGNYDMNSPIVVDAVYKDSSRDISNASRFHLPIGTAGPASGCETMFEREQRMESELTQRQIKAVEEMQKAIRSLRLKYFVIASLNHQHQLALFLNSVTPYFPTSFEKRILVYRFRKDTPEHVPCFTEPLKRAGMNVSILFKASNDHWILYYIYVDSLLQILLSKVRELYQPFLPWMAGLDPPCWKLLEALLTHPNNTHIVDDIRYVMELVQRNPWLGGTPDRCVRHADDIHKKLQVD